MRMKILGGAALLIALVQCSFGATITSGFFSISGTIYVTNFTTAAVTTPAGTCPASTTGSECIFWQDSAGTTDSKTDISASGLPNGNIPASIAGNDAATIDSLINPPAGVGTFPAEAFMSSFLGGVTTELFITTIEAGIYSSTECTSPPAVGQTCTLAGSLFNFVNNPPSPGQATATWVFAGTTDTPGVTWIGNFTAQFPGSTPYQTVLSELATNGYVSNTFSATITLTPPITIPEPGTMSLMMIGTGLVGLASILRRRSAK
jgi:hypothetical protein